MKGSRCVTVATALLTLVALKAYIEWSAEQEERFPTPHEANWRTSAFTPVQATVEDAVAEAPLRFNASLQQLRQSIQKSSAYWNRKQHQIFQALDAGWKNASAHKCDRPRDAERVSNFGTYSQLYRDFILYDECRSFPLLIDQPSKCSCSKNSTFLLLAIKSLPGNFAARQAVRDSWGQEGEHDGLPVRTVFLMGTAKGRHGPNLQRMVEYESQTFGDILMWDFEDTFFNLTLKDFLFLNWTLERCRDVRFILKGDDDVFINTPKVVDYLSSLDNRKPIYVGQVMANASPFRVRKSKYYVPESYYVGPYPAYAGGGGYIFSGMLAPWLHAISQYIPFYPIDDVYTGLCFQALGIRPEAHAGFQTFDIAEKDRENPCVHRELLLVHQRSPHQTLHLWKQIRDPSLTC
ncbi:UDP-GlcNAc:betaGal beta-1,3-N-acetylglucosaminyltransferase 8 [Sphaerodactylus townsendi]|uniref:UDP-GlcNAc:betaGal beta-1,3-N-acetylglucosaminyltransferase 8 n=1 Tax=Sphaerodactylus townsendi TaxID=933632 RepID=UPI002026D1A9|nr:UDP-GlcNAc:betaGal beta-1,3-N-acetylglucosaminyltransferase 8 [Sphaerodactylus townsendi]